MEFFQTIWPVLTTPNENLANNILNFNALIEVTVEMLLFTTILNIQSTKKQKIVYVLTLSFIGIMTNAFVPNPFKILLHICIWPILIMAIFKVNFLKSIFAIILPIIITALLEMIYLKICLIFFSTSYYQTMSIPIYREIVALALYLLTFILYKLAKHFNINITLLDNMDKNTKLLMTLNLIIVVISIGCQFYLIDFYSDKAPLLITMLSILSLITYFFISMYSLTRTTQLQIANQNLEESQLYNKSLKILHDNVRGFKHDFSNIVQAIGRICYF